MKWALLVTVLSGAAFAESECRQPVVLFPEDGATNVPLNAVPRGLHADGLDVTLLRRTGDIESVVTTTARSDDTFVTSFVPGEALLPNTEYVLTLQDTRQVFTTGSTVDESAPTLGGVTLVKASEREWQLQFEPDPEPGTLVFIRNESRVVSVVGSEVRALSTNCRGFFLPASKTFDVDVQLMDLAGNVSNTSTARDVEGFSGCASSPAGALVLLAVVALLRRYRAVAP
ncbi:MAG: hypothetical protein ACO1OB_28665 [Archangium sp.]